MSKRLIMILALAFVVGMAFTAYAEVQNVKVSGDITAMGIMRDLTLGSTSNDVKTDKSMASITRVKVDADLTDNVMTTVRLLNERYWGSETESAGVTHSNSNISLDLAYVTLKEFLYSPLTLIVGRQELHYGNDMIIGDPDTNNMVSTASAFSSLNARADADLSARKGFDAIRLILNYDPLVVDLVTAKITENARNTKDDVTLHGINANFALTKTTNLEGYYFGRVTGNKAGTGDKTDRVDTVGARLVVQPIDILTYQLEGAYQFGKRAGTATVSSANRRAFALETALSLNFKNMKMIPSLTAGYAYFSGQKSNDNKRVNAWDPMYENQKFGDIANAQFLQSNAHIAMLNGSIKPVEDITLKAEYYLFWWDKRYHDDQIITTVRGDTVVMENNKFAGSELDLKASYDYTEDVQFNLLTGLFKPGGAFSSNNDELASEVIGSMKVTF